MSIAYLLVLVVLLGCMALIDHRWRLVFWHDARRAALTMAIGLAFFVVWDLAGIGLGIFFRAENDLMTGILLAPELPLEEIFFLAFLCYQTLVLYTLARRLLGRREAS
ncbi:lycopene cyclase domain-containing protein [Pseudactinotalea sp.]|uniref:lycopene cyclase domain-containing protein n=1 Tax=Pseudactinotalea sp. TaxID=1926260 RepID=UPI003B39FFEE